MEFINGEAEILLKSVEPDKLCAAGGGKAIFKILHEKYSPQPIDLLHTALKTCFCELQANLGESCSGRELQTVPCQVHIGDSSS